MASTVQANKRKVDTMTTYKQRQFKRELVRALPDFASALVVVAMLGLALIALITI